MIYQNNFRYGEISRKNAGRFDMEAYSQGAFQFTNAQTMTSGGFRRRPPLKIELRGESTKGLLRLIPFSISETISYCVGFTMTGIRLFRFVGNTLTETAESSYPDNLVMSDKIVQTMSYSQYYDRMYFASNSFFPFFIEINTSLSSFVAKMLPILVNQDGKGLVSTVPELEDMEGASDELKELAGKRLYVAFVDGKKEYYLDEEMTEKYIYAESFPPVPLSPDTSIGFESFPDENDICVHGDSSTYPAIVSIINDSMYLGGTIRRPHTIWKSRTLGSSQWIHDYSSDSMHDFITFQLAYTETEEIVDMDKIPQKQVEINGEKQWFQEAGVDMWFVPTVNTATGTAYSESEWQYQKYEEQLIRTEEVDPSTGATISITWTYKSSGARYEDAGAKPPVKKPILEYDFSNPDAIIKTKTDITLVATDSCGMKIDLNSGRQDKIISITSACERIIVRTSTAEYILPASFSAVSNNTASLYGHHGSENIRPALLNDSFLFIQKGNTMREFFLSEGYLNRRDLCAINREILDGDIVGIEVKNSPEPLVYVLMNDGTMRTLIYDKELGIQAWSRWSFGNNKIKSLSTIETGGKIVLLCLVDAGGTLNICSFDEATESYLDFGTEVYVTRVETPYAEIIDNTLVFGRYKRARSAWVRPYKTGYIFMGNDIRQMSKTPYKLDSDDYRFVHMGTSNRKFSMIMESSEADPMNILALAWEAE